MEVVKSLRPGDIIRARVISLGDSTQYFLSTAENELGVRWAKSAAGAIMIPISWQVRENALATLRRRPFQFFLWCVLAHLAVMARGGQRYTHCLPNCCQCMGKTLVPCLRYGSARRGLSNEKKNTTVFCFVGRARAGGSLRNKIQTCSGTRKPTVLVLVHGMLHVPCPP